ncbi:hypothetical protein [Fibrella aestuarina]|nr:hypothetical protein [Fibrella aestuarina]
MVGFRAGYVLTTGTSNTYFGAGSGKNNVTGSRNTFVGRDAGPDENTDDNVYVGYATGQHDRGSQNTFLGTEAGVLAQAPQPLHNATAIGAHAQVAVSNAVVLGNQANVGIGTSAPTARLHVSSDQADESGLRLEKLTASSPARTTTDQFLTVNERGEVVKGRYRIQISQVAEWSDKVFAPGYPLMPLDEVAAFVKANQHLPHVPSAEQVVKQGVDAAQLNAKLLEKIEELTLYLIDQKNQINQLKQEVADLKARR